MVFSMEYRPTGCRFACSTLCWGWWRGVAPAAPIGKNLGIWIFHKIIFHHRQLLVGAVSRGHLHHDTLAGHEEGGDEDEEDVVEEEGGEEDGADAQAR